MYIGVDLGTSFSQAATMYNGFPLVLLSPAEYGVPSEFYYDDEVGVQVGANALGCAQGVNSKNLVSEIKMKLLQTPSIRLAGRTFTSEEILGQIYKTVLLKAKNIAKTKMINETIEGMVLTIPVNFGYQEKSIISDAAKKCMGSELNITGVIKEPVAAAIAYYDRVELADNKPILVFDLGGGTCDVALVKADRSLQERFTVVDADMERVGGRDWDSALIDYIASEVEKKSGIRIRDDEYYQEDMRAQAISAKKQLSEDENTTAFVRIGLRNGRIIQIPISLSLFDELTMGLLDKALNCLKRVYDRNIAQHNIEEIICVGGSSNMLQVEREIKQMFPGVTVRLYDPEHAVVNGAAIYASTRKNVIDISSFSYGIRAYKDYNRDPNQKIIINLVHKGQTLAATGSHNFYPPADNMNSVGFSIFESENTAEQYDIFLPKTEIGTVSFPLPPNTKKDFVIKCNITLKGDGFLEFTAVGENGQKIPARFEVTKK